MLEHTSYSRCSTSEEKLSRAQDRLELSWLVHKGQFAERIPGRVDFGGTISASGGYGRAGDRVGSAP
jgi:hypothetical protein